MGTNDAPLIVAAIPSTGHTRPMLELARGLVSAGRAVTFLGGSRFAEDARATGATFVALRGVADFDERRVGEMHPRLSTLPAGPERLGYLFQWFGDMAPDQHASLQELHRPGGDALVLYDMAFLGCWPTLLGAPGVRGRAIGVGRLPFMLPGAEVTVMGAPPPVDGLDVRGAAAAVNANVETALAPARDHVQKVLDGLGARQRIESFLTAVYTLPDAFAQLTVPGFEYPRSDLPATVHFVGTVAPQPDSSSFYPPPWWPDLMGRDVVVVTQGTVANQDLGQLVQPTLDALAEADVLVVAAVGREPRPGELRVPPNARIATYVPFDVLFPLAKAVVINGGYGGTQLALAHGLPVVVAGDSENTMTASRVGAFGMGLDLGTPNPEPSAVGEAVERVLRDPSFRVRAGALAEEYRTTDPISAILELVDRLRPRSKNLSFNAFDDGK